MGMRQVTIRPVLSGWVVGVGCQEMVFSDRRQLMIELDRYLEHPDVEEQRWVAGAVNPPNDAGPTILTTDTNRFANRMSVGGGSTTLVTGASRLTTPGSIQPIRNTDG